MKPMRFDNWNEELNTIIRKIEEFNKRASKIYADLDKERDAIKESALKLKHGRLPHNGLFDPVRDAVRQATLLTKDTQFRIRHERLIEDLLSKRAALYYFQSEERRWEAQSIAEMLKSVYIKLALKARKLSKRQGKVVKCQEEITKLELALDACLPKKTSLKKFLNPVKSKRKKTK